MRKRVFRGTCIFLGLSNGHYQLRPQRRRTSAAVYGYYNTRAIFFKYHVLIVPIKIPKERFVRKKRLFRVLFVHRNYTNVKTDGGCGGGGGGGAVNVTWTSFA